MFAELADGARSVRNHLVVGYTALFTFWLLWGDRLPEREGLDSPASVVVDLYHRLSAAGQAALWTFVALMFGAFLCRIVLDKLVDWVLLGGPDWDEYINAARLDARQYEEHRAYAPATSTSGGRYLVPSAAWSSFLADEIKDRQRQQSEIRFRVLLGLCLLVPATVLIVRGGGGWWWFTLLPTLAVAIDITWLQHPVNIKIHQAVVESLTEQRQAAAHECEQLDDQISKLTSEGSNTGQLQPRLQRAEEERDALDQRLTAMQVPSRLSLWRLHDQSGTRTS